MKRVLVIGGTGSFGRRLVSGLIATSDCEVVIAARDLSRAQALADEMNVGTSASRATAMCIDVRTTTADELNASGAFLVVDAAGPFQTGSYRLARAAIAAKMHYVDLADARDFVAGFTQLDDEAKVAGITALTGASSTPALSNAVLDRVTNGWREVETIEIAISPGNRAPRGLAVVQSILSYVGRPVKVFLDGNWTARPGWGMTTRKQIRHLGRRWLSLCETPDLDIVVARFAPRRSAIFRAGLELSFLHLGLVAGSLLVRIGLLRSLLPLARFCRAVAAPVERFGTDRGGMVVEASGIDAAGQASRVTWTLVAEAGDGPVIPTLPALAAIRALAADGWLRAGAGACAGVLDLEMIAAEFAPYRIMTLIDTPTLVEAPLFARALGERFASLPAPIRQVHSPQTRITICGEATVDGSARALPKLVRRLLGFPRPGKHVALRVEIEAQGGIERWTRDFAGQKLTSTLMPSRVPARIRERFGLIACEFCLAADADGLSMEMVGANMGPLPLPGFLAPTTRAREWVDEEGKFRFDVEIGVGFIGHIVSYNGWLRPQA
jgi:saccharopine dehydrogenase-like NADP-dependent oxidoreductase